MFWQSSVKEKDNEIADGLMDTAEPPVDVAVELNGRDHLHTEIKVDLHRRVVALINLSVIDDVPIEELREEVSQIVEEQLEEEGHALNTAEREQLAADVLDELLGLGPLEPLLKDPRITDILVNTFDQVFIEIDGKLQLTRVIFKDDRHLLRIITKIVNMIGRRVDESQPMVDARLPDGSRVNAIIPPLAVDGPLLSIRKFAKIPIDLERLIELGSLPREIAEVLETVVKCRRNVLISGGTGSGKTTLLNAMSAYIDGAERIITIEDSAELQLQQTHVGRLETRPTNVEEKGEVTQRDLVKNSLRMRPDRIIVGEVRSGEAFDMLQAMNTGHEGSMTTVHANSCRDGISRIEQMVGMSGVDISPRATRSQIASAIHIVVQLQRMSDGKRRLMSVSEITGMEGDVLTMQEIFRFRRISTDPDGRIIGHFEATGIRPRFLEEAEARGLELPAEIFGHNRILEAAS